MDRETFRDGLALGNLNPPEIAAFFQGVSRRAGQQLSALTPGLEPGDLRPITNLLRSMTDQVADLTERLQSVGYPLAESGHVDDHEATIAEDDPTDSAGHSADPGHSADSGGPSETESHLPAETVGALDRFRAGADQAGRQLSGIPSRGWESRSELLNWGRQAVGDVALSLRSLAELVSETNERADADDHDHDHDDDDDYADADDAETSPEGPTDNRSP